MDSVIISNRSSYGKYDRNQTGLLMGSMTAGKPVFLCTVGTVPKLKL